MMAPTLLLDVDPAPTPPSRIDPDSIPRLAVHELVRARQNARLVGLWESGRELTDDDVAILALMSDAFCAHQNAVIAMLEDAADPNASSRGGTGSWRYGAELEAKARRATRALAQIGGGA